MLSNNENAVPYEPYFPSSRSSSAIGKPVQGQARPARAKAVKSGAPRPVLSDISNVNKQTHDGEKPSKGLGLVQRKNSRDGRAAVRGRGSLKSEAEVVTTRSREAVTRRRRSTDVGIFDTKEPDLMAMDVEMDKDTEADSATLIAAVVDCNDAQPDLFFSEYAHDIYQFMRESEKMAMASPTYMQLQPDISARMREILIDWLIEVHLKFKLEPETLFLTVNIIDRFLQRRAVTLKKLQLVGCAAMLLASKYEEIYAPEVRDFVYISDQAYSREQILAMETIMLNNLDFNLTCPSSLRFTDRLCKVIKKSTDELFKAHVHYFLELTLQDYNFIKFTPSMVATSAMYIAGRICSSSALSRDASYTPELQAYTGYTPEQLQECVSAMWSLVVADSSQVRYRAVRSKYSSSKFFNVARSDFTFAHCPLFERIN
jgi:cyclin B